MASVPVEAHSQQIVGMFWDMDSLPVPSEVDPSGFLSLISTLGSSYSANNMLSISKVFGDKSNVSQLVLDLFNFMQFEFEDIPKGRHSTTQDMALDIIKWWSHCKNEDPAVVPCAVLISDDRNLPLLLNNLPWNHINIILISDEHRDDVNIEWQSMVSQATLKAEYPIISADKLKSMIDTFDESPISPNVTSQGPTRSSSFDQAVVQSSNAALSTTPTKPLGWIIQDHLQRYAVSGSPPTRPSSFYEPPEQQNTSFNTRGLSGLSNVTSTCSTRRSSLNTVDYSLFDENEESYSGVLHSLNDNEDEEEVVEEYSPDCSNIGNNKGYSTDNSNIHGKQVNNNNITRNSHSSLHSNIDDQEGFFSNYSKTASTATSTATATAHGKQMGSISNNYTPSLHHFDNYSSIPKTSLRNDYDDRSQLSSMNNNSSSSYSMRDKSANNGYQLGGVGGIGSGSGIGGEQSAMGSGGNGSGNGPMTSQRRSLPSMMPMSVPYNNNNNINNNNNNSNHRALYEDNMRTRSSSNLHNMNSMSNNSMPNTLFYPSANNNMMSSSSSSSSVGQSSHIQRGNNPNTYHHTLSLHEERMVGGGGGMGGGGGGGGHMQRGYVSIHDDVHDSYYDSPSESSSSNILESITHEQSGLFQALSMAFTTRNIKAAVSTLRQVYTKQCRRFRIPNLLSIIIPETIYPFPNNDSKVGLSSIVFTLNCIQWCFTGKRIDSVDSFKYKMNKNIARWLLKEQQRKHIPPQLTPDVVNLCVSVSQFVYQSTAELEFGMEILLSHHINNPKAILSTTNQYESQSNPYGNTSNLGTSNVVLPANRLHTPTVHESLQLEERLIRILERASAEGVLGAHMPAIYKEHYGEQLHLHGRKLKDVLLGTNVVDMLGGENSPGGKRFRLSMNYLQSSYATTISELPLDSPSSSSAYSSSSKSLGGGSGMGGVETMSMSHLGQPQQQQQHHYASSRMESNINVNVNVNPYVIQPAYSNNDFSSRSTSSNSNNPYLNNSRDNNSPGNAFTPPISPYSESNMVYLGGAGGSSGSISGNGNGGNGYSGGSSSVERSLSGGGSSSSTEKDDFIAPL